MNLKLSAEGIRYIALFESLTGATVRDCVVDDENDRVILVVKKGDMGIAIGKRGSNINRVKKAIGKHIEIVEHSDDVYEFIENTFQPAMIKKVNIVDKEDKRLAYVSVVSKDKGLAIGRNGRNIQKAKMLVQRHHGLDDVIID
ncbi:MAG: NusA-like transcription termination signal-binding factor [Euryarchaeota archaeon]|nr:NusA-like transcription termination signal-binding factor [Euryarchaeota archaeon]MDI6639366.1 NusA-like transcription termination signal-binding factor [Methanocellales archaeon]MDI6903273.1 NusA-like transcription termination signal-binding factor [Methanocellales archaeon]